MKYSNSPGFSKPPKLRGEGGHGSRVESQEVTVRLPRLNSGSCAGWLSELQYIISPLGVLVSSFVK